VSTSGVQANDGSLLASISDDGRFVAFPSMATNLVAGDTNATSDVFVRDRGLFAGFGGSWERVSLRCAPRRPPRRCTASGRLEITNPGELAAARSRVHFFLSANRSLGRRDRLLRRLTLARLTGGRTRTVRFRRELRRDVSRRFLIARLDATGRVREPNERDNVIVSEPLSRKRIRLRVRGRPKRGARSSLRIRITNARRRAIRSATVSVSGAGLERITARTARNGTIAVGVTPPRFGTLKIRASRRGYATATVYRRVR
jgi:hypothetical protein